MLLSVRATADLMQKLLPAGAAAAAGRGSMCGLLSAVVLLGHCSQISFKGFCLLLPLLLDEAPRCKCWCVAGNTHNLIVATACPSLPAAAAPTFEGIHHHDLVRVACAACLHAYGCLNVAGGDEAIILQCCVCEQQHSVCVCEWHRDSQESLLPLSASGSAT